MKTDLKTCTKWCIKTSVNKNLNQMLNPIGYSSITLAPSIKVTEEQLQHVGLPHPLSFGLLSAFPDTHSWHCIVWEDQHIPKYLSSI